MATDYEKKYKEVLEWARKNKARLNGLPIEEVLPELAESEDERIRRWLCDYFSSIDKAWIHKDITCIDILKWLEKQKECVSNNFDDVWDEEDCEEIIAEGKKLTPRFKELLKEVCHAWYDRGAKLEKQKDASKAIEAVERIDKYIDENLANAHDMKDSNPDKKYYRGWDDALGEMARILQDVYSNEKQKESLRDFIDNFPYSAEKEEKPVKPSDDELQRHQDELYNFKVFAAKQAKEHHISYVHDFEWNNFCEGLLSYFNEKQKQDWNEEDKQNLSVCLTYIKDTQLRDWLIEAFHNKYNNSAEWNEEDKKMLGKVLECIRFAEDRYQLEQEETNGVSVKSWLLDHIIPQSKQELSEEETKDLVHILKVLDDCYVYGQHDLSKTDYDNLTSTIKSLKLSWKPSEEQKPVEWSEEGKRKLNRIYEIIGQAADEKPFGSSKRIIGDKEAIELQDFIKSLRPSWKPSEEQMKALSDACCIAFEEERDFHPSLSRLYHDLKKL